MKTNKELQYKNTECGGKRQKQQLKRWKSLSLGVKNWDREKGRKSTAIL